MREFMTRVSDYLSERREDPERKEDRLSLAVIAAVAIVAVVLLLLFWWGYTAYQKRESAEKAKALQESAKLADVQEESQELAVTYEEKMKEYLSQNSGEELRQEFLSDTNALAEKVHELQDTMESVEKEVTRVVVERGESDTVQKETLSTLESSVQKATENIRKTESKLADLSDMMQAADREKLPALQAQIKDVRTEIERSYTEVSGIRGSVSSLQQEDEKLWKELAAVERNLDKAIDKNLKEIDNQLDKTAKSINEIADQMDKSNDQIRQMENKMNELSQDALSYRYDRKSNTLYLIPSSGEVSP